MSLTWLLFHENACKIAPEIALNDVKNHLTFLFVGIPFIHYATK